MDAEKLFSDLNEELAKSGLTLDLLCVGGFVLEYHNMRSTEDIDAFYQESSDLIECIDKVGKENGISESEERWLNNSVSNLNRKPPESVCHEILSYSNLTVTIPSLIYMLGMKLESARKRDIKDAGVIIRSERFEDLLDTAKSLEDLGFQIDFSVLMEAFEIAYDIEWLTEYLDEHIEEIRNLY
jgi:hypothetical protein